MLQFATNATDQSGEVLITEKPEFQQFFELFQEYYNIPGIFTEENKDICVFCEDRAAMGVSWHRFLGWGWGDAESMANMDIAPVPVWSHLPDTGPTLQTWPIMIAEYSEHKDEAFEVLKAYVSEENQIAMGRMMASGPTTTYPEVQASFGADLEFYADKNVEAFSS